MHDIRSSFVPGEGVRKTVVAAKKKAKSDADGSRSLAGLSIDRKESRVSDHRREDRDYQFADAATLIVRRKKHPATLINISPSGAMVKADVELRIGSVLELQIEDLNRMRGRVVWIRSERFGIEFDEQTEILTTGRTRAAIVAAHQVAASEPLETQRSMMPRSTRHGLVWNGTLYWTFEAFNVRIRNISSGGALLDCERTLPQGAPIRLNLSDAGTFPGEVRWSRNGQIGIKFDRMFDVATLVSAQPIKQERADRMVKPNYLRSDGRPDSPWSAQWDQVRPEDFRRG
jgi:hypothetical protein